MACTRQMGMDNPPDKLVKLDIFNVRRLKPMLPSGAYRAYVTAHVLFFAGLAVMAVKGLITLLS